MKKSVIIILMWSVLAGFLTSCYKDFEQIPHSRMTSENFFHTLEESEIAVNGIYSGMCMLGGPYGEGYVKLATHGTHVATNLSPQTQQNLYALFNYDKADKALLNIWQGSYVMIFRANQAISRLSANFDFPAGSDQFRLQHRLIGEARFLRALTYFNLVRFWGDVPLLTDELTDFDNVNAPRSPTAKIYEVIVEDLLFAEKYLYHAHWSDRTPAYPQEALGRATCGAATALLSKVYLTMASWPLRQTEYYQLAYEKAREVIDGKEYALEPDYGRLFTIEGESSKEWIFQVQNDYLLQKGNIWGGVNNPGGPDEALDKGAGRTNPALDLIMKYDYRDPRFTYNIAKGKLNARNEIVENPNQKNWYSYKYRFSEKPVFLNTSQNAPLLRYADVLLVFAEAAAHLDGKETEAYDAMDEVRKRAEKGGEYPLLTDRTLTGEALWEEIMWDRARELCFEGTSRFDLVRYGREVFLRILRNQKICDNFKKQKINGTNVFQPNPAKTRKAPYADLVDEHFMFFPIPEAEMNSNTALMGHQNPGYN